MVFLGPIHSERLRLRLRHCKQIIFYGTIRMVQQCTSQETVGSKNKRDHSLGTGPYTEHRNSLVNKSGWVDIHLQTS